MECHDVPGWTRIGKYFSCFFKLPLTHLPFLAFPCSLTPCNLVLRFQRFFYWDTSLGFRFLSVQSLSHVQLFVTPWTAARQASLSITNSQSLLKLMSMESVMPSNHLILCHPLPLLLSDQHHGLIQWDSSSHQVPKYWSFSFSISPSNEHSGLISFRIDWLELLTVQGTLKSLLQHHSSKASILQCSAFFIVQLSYSYMISLILEKPKLWLDGPLLAK